MKNVLASVEKCSRNYLPNTNLDLQTDETRRALLLFKSSDADMDWQLLPVDLGDAVLWAPTLKGWADNK